MENQYELGNLCFGNSRGPFAFPDRELVSCDEWNKLMDILQIDDYHCIMGDYYNGEKRTNGLCATEYGGYICKDEEGHVLFELFPYWWDGCTCGADEKNSENYDWIRRLYLSDVELNDYYSYCCMDEEELNEVQKKAFQNLKYRMMEVDAKYEKKYYVEHDKECLVLKHNFVFRPGTEKEIWIDWYKYPFRDAHASKELTSEEVKAIFKACIEDAKRAIKGI